MSITIAAYTWTETVSTTEWSMTTDTAGPDSTTADGRFQPFVSVPSAAVAADEFEVALYETINAVQVPIQGYKFVLKGTGAAYGWAGPEMVLGVGWDWTIKKLVGTDRALAGHINQIDSEPTANQIADALLDRAAGVETGLTVRQCLRLAAAVLFGKSAGMSTATGTFRNPADDKTRVSATLDGNGNRSAVTLDST